MPRGCELVIGWLRLPKHRSHTSVVLSVVAEYGTWHLGTWAPGHLGTTTLHETQSPLCMHCPVLVLPYRYTDAQLCDYA